MFFKRKVEPVERSKVLKVVGKWHRDTEAVDNATDAMRLVAAEDPAGIQSESFEEKRLAAVEIVRELLDQTKDQLNWPELEDDKGWKLMSVLQMSWNETLVQQLDSLRLQREYVEALKSGRATGADMGVISSLHHRMADTLVEMGRAAGRLAKHYKVTRQEYVHATRSPDR